MKYEKYGPLKRHGWIGGSPSDYEIQERAHEQRQIDKARTDADERRKRGQDAISQLAKAREQLLALSMLLYQQARVEEQAGSYEMVDRLHKLARTVRDIRANKTVTELGEVE